MWGIVKSRNETGIITLPAVPRVLQTLVSTTATLTLVMEGKAAFWTTAEHAKMTIPIHTKSANL